MRRMLLLITLMTLAAASAVAQTWPPHAGASVSDRHRFEMDRLRARSDEQAAFARQQALSARLTALELQAARQPTLPPTYTPGPLRSPEAERGSRERATAERQSAAAGVTQIDAWLYRPSQ